MPFSERSGGGLLGEVARQLSAHRLCPQIPRIWRIFKESFADGSPALPRSSSSSSSPSLPPPPTTEDSSEEADSVDISGVVPPSFQDLLAMSSSLILIKIFLQCFNLLVTRKDKALVF